MDGSDRRISVDPAEWLVAVVNAHRPQPDSLIGLLSDASAIGYRWPRLAATTARARHQPLIQPSPPAPRPSCSGAAPAPVLPWEIDMPTFDSDPQPAALESVLRDAWDAFHPGQPAPLGWLTHTATRIHDHLGTHQPAPAPPAAPAPSPAVNEQVAGLRRQVWRAVRDAVGDDDVDPDAANRLLTLLDLPGLPRHWQVRLTLPLTISVTATDPDDAFDTAESVIDDALDASGHDSHIDWSAAGRDDATPGDLDRSADDPPGLR